jgi:hypothetical protein
MCAWAICRRQAIFAYSGQTSSFEESLCFEGAEMTSQCRLGSRSEVNADTKMRGLGLGVSQFSHHLSLRGPVKSHRDPLRGGICCFHQMINIAISPRENKSPAVLLFLRYGHLSPCVQGPCKWGSPMYRDLGALDKADLYHLYSMTDRWNGLLQYSFLTRQQPADTKSHDPIPDWA